MLIRALYDLDHNSFNYWSMFFSISISIFKRSHEIGLLGDDMSIELLKKIDTFLSGFKRYNNGKTIIPTFFEVETRLNNMVNMNHYILLQDRSYTFGIRTKEISKFSIIQQLSDIRQWVYDLVNSIDIRYSQHNLNVNV